MINVHHMYNKGTTPLSHGVGSTHYGAHSMWERCCTLVVHVVYGNHLSRLKWDASNRYLMCQAGGCYVKYYTAWMATHGVSDAWNGFRFQSHFGRREWELYAKDFQSHFGYLRLGGGLPAWALQGLGVW